MTDDEPVRDLSPREAELAVAKMREMYPPSQLGGGVDFFELLEFLSIGRGIKQYRRHLSTLKQATRTEHRVLASLTALAGQWALYLRGRAGEDIKGFLDWLSNLPESDIQTLEDLLTVLHESQIRQQDLKDIGA